MSRKRGTLLVVTGNNGSGKSEFAKIVAKALGLQAVPDSPGDYPYFDDFLTDKRRWAFHNQLQFMSHKFHQQKTALDSNVNYCQERSAYDCYEVFTKWMYEHNLMSEREFETIRSYYQLLTSLVPFPDLIVHLESPSALLLQRVRARDRGIDFEIDEQYLEDIHRRYAAWIRTVDFCPVMMIDTSVYDLVHDPEARDAVLYRVATALGLRLDSQAFT